ncbi:glycosyltransferase [Mycolicibacterium sarraceniae]|uniref:glycosyltransferase n=1 Tax=Mycolicibacterium sarraceniae TaxID=1534348 RepID=UPI001C65DDF7|nr:glycosyltransferase [Mycolicibacterium sarraceniae]
MKVLIVAYRREDLLRRCVDQLRSYFALSDLLIVDNRSEESQSIADYCLSMDIAIIRNEHNEGFAKAVNIGMRHLSDSGDDPWVFLLNPDTELLVDPNELVRFSTASSACLTTFDAAAKSPWDSEKPIPNPWRAAWEDSGLGRLRLPQPLGSRYRSFSQNHKGYLVGCFLLVSTAAWQRVGPFDERFWLYSEETDWCLRAYKEGMDCQVIPVLGYRHYARQASLGDPAVEVRSMNAYRKSRKLFIEKYWGGLGIRSYELLLSLLLRLRRVASYAHRLPGSYRSLDASQRSARSANR